MPSELDMQLLFMTEAHYTGPENYQEFVDLSPFERRQVVQQCAGAEIRRLSEGNHGVRWKTEDMDWGEAMLLATQLRQDEPTDLLGALRERGVPMVADEEPAPVDNGDSTEFVTALRERGVPLTSRAAEPAKLTWRAALADSKIPMREGASVLDRPHHELIRDLDATIPDGHPDRDFLPDLVSAGAALSTDQRGVVDALASKHLDPLRTDFDDLTDDDMPDSASSLNSGSKQEMPSSTARQLNSGTAIKSLTASAGSLSTSGGVAEARRSVYEQVTAEEFAPPADPGLMFGERVLREGGIPLKVA